MTDKTSILETQREGQREGERERERKRGGWLFLIYLWIKSYTGLKIKI